MANSMSIVDLSATTTYPTTPQVSLPFEAQMIVVNEGDGDAVVFVSFDGANDHAALRRSSPTQAIAFQAKRKKCWLRMMQTSATTFNAQVISEAT